MDDLLQIEKKNALTAYDRADNVGKKLLSDLLGEQTFKLRTMESKLRTMESIATISDVFAAAGANPAEHVVHESNTVKQNLLICIDRVMLLPKVFNEGWVYDITDLNQAKHYPCFTTIIDKNSPGGFRLSFRGSDYDFDASRLGVRPHYKNGKISDYVGKTFVQEYTQLAYYQHLFLQQINN